MEHDHGQPSAGGLVTDPVCGMTIDPAKAAGTSEAGGAVVYFCSLGCKRKFDAEPARFLASMGRPAPGAEVTKGQLAANDGAQQHAVQEDAPTAPASSVRSLPQPTQETIYTCPMHPEVRQERPGEVAEVRDGPRAGAGGGSGDAHRVDLPDASRDRARRPGRAPSAAWPWSRAVPAADGRRTPSCST